MIFVLFSFCFLCFFSFSFFDIHSWIEEIIVARRKMLDTVNKAKQNKNKSQYSPYLESISACHFLITGSSLFVLSILVSQWQGVTPCFPMDPRQKQDQRLTGIFQKVSFLFPWEQCLISLFPQSCHVENLNFNNHKIFYCSMVL